MVVNLTITLGGHLRPDLYDRIPTYIRRYGVDAAAEVANFELSHVKAFKNLLAEENIDCDFNITRCLSVYLDEAAGEKARKKYKELVSRGLAFADDIHYTPPKNAEGVRAFSLSMFRESYSAKTQILHRFLESKVPKHASHTHQVPCGPTSLYWVSFRRLRTRLPLMCKHLLRLLP